MISKKLGVTAKRSKSFHKPRTLVTARSAGMTLARSFKAGKLTSNRFNVALATHDQRGHANGKFSRRYATHVVIGFLSWP